MNFLNEAMRASLFAFCIYVTTHVNVTTTINTIPRYN